VCAPAAPHWCSGFSFSALIEPLLVERWVDGKSVVLPLPGGGVGCLWTLERDAVVASLIPLEEGHFVQEMIPHLGELYVVFSTPRGPELTRRRSRAAG
jgi:hypothetical protein